MNETEPATGGVNFFKTPLHFCVLIPCYNDADGLVLSLQSIHYTPDAFAVVVVDDGSALPLAVDDLKQAAPNIRHLHLIRLPQNSGITTALNTGLRWILEHTAAPYIARLDCRDTCHPQRFFKQVTFLNAHTEVGLLGSWCTFTEAAIRRTYLYKTPLEHSAIIKAMHQRNVFIHPSVMFRAALVNAAGFYPSDFPHAEDYAFFWKLLTLSKGAILEEVLTDCAITHHGISLANRREQLRNRRRVVQAFGSNAVLQWMGYLKLYLLLIMPKGLLLQLKTRAKQT